MIRLPFLVALFIGLVPSAIRSADLSAKTDIPAPKFERQVIDANIQIGYGLAVGDVDGDGKPDILLADKRQIVWYRNPDWKRFVMAEDLTPQDNVCIAARDIDGSGKVSVAVGAGWNPNETTDPTKSGAVFYLIRPKDPTQHWEPVRLHHEVTTHRMAWVKAGGGKFQLVVLPLHGLGNKNGEGNGVRILAYDVPKDPHGEWTTHLIDDSMHMTHNFDVVESQQPQMEEILVAGREGVRAFAIGNRSLGKRSIAVLTNSDMKARAGEVRVTNFVINTATIATIEPMHGNQVIYYLWSAQDRKVHVKSILDESLAEGHALASADLLGVDRDQIVAGWRAPNRDKKVGNKLYVQLDLTWMNTKFQTYVIDDNQMACEDLKIADLDGDGQPDIIASGRATHNLVIYWNRTKAR